MVQTAIQTDEMKFLKIKHQFVAEIEFGVLSQKCKNFGICRIIPIRWEGFDPGKRNITIVTLLENQHLELIFFKHFLPSDKYQKFFSTGFFIVDEDYRFDASKNESQHFRIAKGRYPINESATMLTILFPATNLQ